MNSEQTADKALPLDESALLAAPTPVTTIREEPGAVLWLKNDGLSSTIYGGNKARKLVHWLRIARQRGARELLTIGAAGSHHALATCLFAREAGLAARAVLRPQPWTAHAEATLLAGLEAGLEVVPARSDAHAAWLLMQLGKKKGTLRIGPGGWGPPGTQAYVEAAEELALQVSTRALPRPAVVYLAAGSGSTAAGLLAGFVKLGWETRVVAVAAAPGSLTRILILSQAARALRARSWSQISRLSGQLEVRNQFVGRGYGYPTEEGQAATAAALLVGLQLDPTYTAKAFACACRDAQQASPERGGPATYVYWHTLSAVTERGRALVGCGEDSAARAVLPRELSQLFLDGPHTAPN